MEGSGEFIQTPQPGRTPQYSGEYCYETATAVVTAPYTSIPICWQPNLLGMPPDIFWQVTNLCTISFYSRIIRAARVICPLCGTFYSVLSKLITLVGASACCGSVTPVADTPSAGVLTADRYQSSADRSIKCSLNLCSIAAMSDNANPVGSDPTVAPSVPDDLPGGQVPGVAIGLPVPGQTGLVTPFVPQYEAITPPTLTTTTVPVPSTATPASG